MAFKRELAYEASAGSGKTFALVVRYITLLFMGANPNTILALTFTNKAANEMKIRIARVLKELDSPKAEAELNEIAKILDKTPQDILKEKQKVLSRYLRSDQKISTIDAFFANILRKFSLYEGLMPDFSIDENIDDDVVVSTFLSLVNSEGLYRELIEFSLYEEKRLDDLFKFLEILYDRDAELENISYEKGDIFALEHHILSLCKKMFELFSANEQINESTLKTLKVDTIDDLLERKWIAKDSMEYWHYKKFYTPEADDLLLQIKGALENYFRYKDGYYKERYFKLFKLFKSAKKRVNKNLNQLKFSDVSFYVYKILRGEVDREFLYFRLDSKIDHLLIDEFQDTNILQYKILEPIIEEIDSGIGVKENKTFFYVGDTKQSIYRFRGGSKELFSYVAKRYGVEVSALNTNYRSQSNIVKFVNETFKNKIEGYTDQLPLSQNSGGYVEVSKSEDVIGLVIDSIKKLLQDGVNPDDIAILTHTNKDVNTIKSAIFEFDPSLKVSTESSMKLIHHTQVSAIIEFLKYLYFEDELYLQNFLTKIGVDPSSNPDLGRFDTNQSLPLLIKKIITHFKIYNRDEALLRFINISCNYVDIEQFLFEYESISQDAPSKGGAGIRILTIFKSKGLEFEHLIVCDRFSGKNNKKEPLLFEYDGVRLKDIYVQLKGRNKIDKRYIDALEKEKELEHSDLLNLLYVAFTRAKYSLFICQKDERSVFDVLDLEARSSGEIKALPKERIHKETVEFDYDKESLKIGSQETLPMEQEDKGDNIKAINFGLALHYMLELLEEFEEQNLQSAYWAMKNRYEILLCEGDCERIYKRVERLIKHKEFLELTKGVVYKEQMVSHKGKIKQLDLLVDHNDKFVIIDYKSSQTPNSKYIDQVRSYKEAISSITDKKVEGYLCYIREDEVVIESV